MRTCSAPISIPRTKGEIEEQRAHQRVRGAELAAAAQAAALLVHREPRDMPGLRGARGLDHGAQSGARDVIQHGEAVRHFRIPLHGGAPAARAPLRRPAGLRVFALLLGHAAGRAQQIGRTLPAAGFGGQEHGVDDRHGSYGIFQRHRRNTPIVRAYYLKAGITNNPSGRKTIGRNGCTPR
jgi:hypothetical protein